MIVAKLLAILDEIQIFAGSATQWRFMVGSFVFRCFVSSFFACFAVCGAHLRELSLYTCHPKHNDQMMKAPP